MRKPEANQDDLYYTDMRVGEILRRTRVYYNQSLTDIERSLRIRASQIEAIEAGETAHLPGRVYVIGFIRSYAEYLGLDGEKIVKLYKRQSGGPAPRQSLNFPVPASESRVPPVWLVLVCLAAVIGIVMGWWMMHDRDRAAAEALMPPAATTSDSVSQGAVAMSADEASAVEAAVDVAPEPAPAIAEEEQADQPAAVAEPAVVSAGIILNIQGNSWVEIKDEAGYVLVSRVLESGDQYYVPNRPDLKMSLGNAGAVRMIVNGQDLGAFGEAGSVLRNIPLDLSFLQNQYGSVTEEDTAE